MRRVLLLAALALLSFPAPASATWSIVAIDRNTGRMVISSATCAATAPNRLKLLQAVVVPGAARRCFRWRESVGAPVRWNSLAARRASSRVTNGDGV